MGNLIKNCFQIGSWFFISGVDVHDLCMLCILTRTRYCQNSYFLSLSNNYVLESNHEWMNEWMKFIYLFMKYTYLPSIYSHTVFVFICLPSIYMSYLVKRLSPFSVLPLSHWVAYFLLLIFESSVLCLNANICQIYSMQIISSSLHLACLLIFWMSHSEEKKKDFNTWRTSICSFLMVCTSSVMFINSLLNSRSWKFLLISFKIFVIWNLHSYLLLVDFCKNMGILLRFTHIHTDVHLFCLYTLVTNQLIIFLWNNFRNICCSVLLIYVSLSSPILHCLFYCTFILLSI